MIFVKPISAKLFGSPRQKLRLLQLKLDLANAALLAHPSTTADTRLVSDASDFSMGAVLGQKFPEGWKLLTFFSRKFTPTHRNYSAYDRKLTAIYESVKFFRHFLEGRNFKILTDHKSLAYAFNQRSDKASPRQARQLSFIAQFTKCSQIPSRIGQCGG